MVEQGKRRSTHIEHALSYAAVGASQVEDLLKYPPADSHPYEYELQLGSGEERYASSLATLMTWRAQQAAGITVELIEQTRGASYTQVQFTKEGLPEHDAQRENLFAADGTAFLEQGDLVRYTLPSGEQRVMRVISVITSPQQAGFVVGTASEYDFSGECWFRVEQREDGSVWAVARGFTFDNRKSGQKLLFKNALRHEHELVMEQLTGMTPAQQAAQKNRGE